MTGLGGLIALGTQSLWLGLLVFLRVGAAVFALPGLGEPWVPPRLRLMLALLLSVAILPAVAILLPPGPPTLALLVQALACETLIGLFLGLILRLFVFALQTAGTIASQATSLSQLLGTVAAEPMPALGHVLSVAALALLMGTGFHVKAAGYLILSYQLMPPMTLPDAAILAQISRNEVSHAFALAFSLAAPFVILSALYNLTLGFINKAMPQLMVAFVGAPVITLGAMALMALVAPMLLSAWLAQVDGFLASPFR
ncbi:flagellar biosynthetic protein FliR [Salipiger mangrovisoli]|uniref:Flagellar biosynthetic protein FliR n=1 Tax=Salipiger mangrovisoli TaxID=2865933 RepID=A0ABR9WXC4_9RHOB|nr:flagellar biosynthetic protein FliR [Salipiger mangrovisoli]MBE9635915.1 flagellar biosynthetic protein FliR [Salipiger mangrovisoli]